MNYKYAKRCIAVLQMSDGSTTNHAFFAPTLEAAKLQADEDAKAVGMKVLSVERAGSKISFGCAFRRDTE